MNAHYISAQPTNKLTNLTSETTATALTFLFYHLARDPVHIQRILNEVRSVNDIRSNDSLHALPYLNACITETLRLHPPTPSGLMRQTPAEGIYVGGTYIPGHVTCLAPTYSIARRKSGLVPPSIHPLYMRGKKVLTSGVFIVESCFERANEFLPERWIDATHLVRDKTGFAAFSIGKHPSSSSDSVLSSWSVRKISIADRDYQVHTPAWARI